MPKGGHSIQQTEYGKEHGCGRTKCGCGHEGDDQPHKLIATVTVSKSTVIVNESVSIRVRLLRSSETVTVMINGTQGSEQHLQFAGPPGSHKIRINAVGRHQHCAESRTVVVNVVEGNNCVVFPLIQVSRNAANQQDSSFEFLVSNFKELTNADTARLQYNWDFGAAGKRASNAANGLVRLNFDEFLNPNAPNTIFHVAVIVTFPSGRMTSAAKTILVWNLYFIQKQRGMIKPPLRYQPSAAKNSDGVYIAKAIIQNLEKEPLHLDQQLIEYLVDDAEAPKMFGPITSVDLTIQPTTSLEVDCSLRASNIPANAYGYAVYFTGRGETSSTPTHVSCYFEHKSPKAAHVIRDPIMKRLIQDLRIDPINAGKLRLGHEDIIRYVEKLKTGPLTNLSQTLFEQRALSTRKPTLKPLEVKPLIPLNLNLDELLAGYGPNEGDKCYPDEEPSEDDLACQLQTEEEEVYVPARIINAFKGDTILSPGGMGPIGILLRALSPPQLYAHCGIMSKNYYEITNSTADQAWLMSHLAGSIFGIGGTEGTEGINPTAAKYVWPGVISQSIGEAFEGITQRRDPDGGMRTVNPFEYRGVPGHSDSIAEPLVLKPNPILEAQLPTIRDTLHRVADAAKKMRGHYRFYCFSDASISGDPSADAPTESPDPKANRAEFWWAGKTRPTCCSSLIWAAAKSLSGPKIQLEGDFPITTDADLEPEDRDPNVDGRTDQATLDGLYRYEEDNRRRAADALYENVAAEAHATMDAFAGGAVGWLANLLTDAADDVGNQVCNTFASDFSGTDDFGNESKDWARWKQPGVGHAVSPDNILMWDAPKPWRNGIQHGLYGYAEKMVYRPAYVERRRVSRWVRVKKTGWVDGIVMFNGSPVANANVNIGGSALICDANGRFPTMKYPVGSYQVGAGKLWADGLYYQGTANITVIANATEHIVINLNPPPDAFRELVINGTVQIVDDDSGFPKFAGKNPSPPYSWIVSGLFFGEYFNQGNHREHDFVQGWADEVRVELHLKMDLLAAGVIRVNWTGQLYEGDSADTNDLDDQQSGSFDVDRNGFFDFRLHLQTSHGDSGDVVLRFENRSKP